MHDPLDPLFDSQLRDVSLPEGMTQRLRGIAEPTDENLDRWLRDVSCPQSILTRCRAIVGNELVDARLRDCDVPVALASRLQAIPFSRRSIPLAALSRAAMMFFIIGGSYCAFFGWFLGSIPFAAHNSRPSIQLNLAYLDYDRAVSVWGEDSDFFVSNDELVTTEELTNIGPNVGGSYPSHMGEPSLTGWEPRVSENTWTLADVRLADEMAKRRRGTKSAEEPSARTLLTHTYLISRQRPVRQTQLALRGPSIAVPQESLFQPLSSGEISAFHSNLNRLEKTFEARPDMKLIEVPVTTDITSFDVFEELVRDGRWPEGLEIRTEEFLAAMRYGFSNGPSRNIAIFPAAAPTPLAQRESILMQIGIKAGGVKGVVSTNLVDNPVTTEVVTLQATATIRFHSQSVKAFRLIGHEPRAVSADTPVIMQGQPLCAGDETVLLFEVWLKPGKIAASTVIADAMVNWNDPLEGRIRGVAGQVRGGDIATTFNTAVPSLQIAAMAAESAEAIRSHRHSDGYSGSIRAVREALRSTKNPLVATPEVQRLVRLLDAAVLLRPELLGK